MTTERQKEIIITNQILALLVVILSLALGIAVGKQKGWVSRQPIAQPSSRQTVEQVIELPKPDLANKTTLAKAISSRRTRRQYSNLPLTTNELSQLLWSMQGKTADWGGRTVPTIKSIYPLNFYVYVKNIEGLDKGLYYYNSQDHQLSQIPSFDSQLVDRLFVSIPSFTEASGIIILTGEVNKFSNQEEKSIAKELIYFEAGHSVQNAYLTAESQGLGVNQLTMFEMDVPGALLLPESEQLITMVTVGKAQAE